MKMISLSEQLMSERETGREEIEKSMKMVIDKMDKMHRFEFLGDSWVRRELGNKV